MDENETKDSEWDNYDANWEKEIELKLSKQGQIIIGLTVGVGVTVLLSVLQGKVTINVIKGQRMLTDAVNTITALLNGTQNPVGHSGVSYAKPEKKVDETKASPIDNEVAEELKRLMEESNQGLNEPDL